MQKKYPLLSDAIKHAFFPAMWEYVRVCHPDAKFQNGLLQYVS